MRLTGWTALALLAATLPVQCAAAAPPRGPVVIFLVDTLRPDRMSAYGASRPTTPAADELARNGVVFERAYALSSWTRPSVATLLTSRLPAESGALNRNGVLNPTVPYLPELFRAAGFRTAAFVGNPNVVPRTGFGRGFDVFESVECADPAHGGHPLAREVVGPALQFVARQTSSRFFLYVHVLDPHADYYLEEKYRRLFERDVKSAGEREALLLEYDRAVRQADDQFALLAAALRAKGFWDSATIIYTSDHGEEFYEHGGKGHGTSLYEEQIRIPLIVKFPGARSGAARRPDLVSLADVVPTLAGLHGLAHSPFWIGADLREKVPERPLYFTEDLDIWRLYAVRSGTRKLVVQLYPKLEQLIFDIGGDPGERHGRALACGEPLDPSAQALVRMSAGWREREMPFFPGTHFEKRANEGIRVVLVANLANQPQPFLTADDYCTGEASLREFVLTVGRTVAAGEPFRLALSTNEKGELPPYRLFVFDTKGLPIDTSRTAAVFRTTKVVPPDLEDAPADEVERLRSLGYLKGGQAQERRP